MSKIFRHYFTHGFWALNAAALATVLLGPGQQAIAQQTTVTVPETVVSASRVPLPSDEVGSSVTIITGEELERGQVRSFSDALRETPGIAVSRTGPVGAFTQLRIRGAEGNHTLVLIDGIEINDISGGSEFDFGNMMASDVERVEILRGPQTALYGSDAIGGVVNIITKRGEGPPTATISAEGGTQHTGLLTGNIRGGNSKYHYAIGGTFFTTSGESVADVDAGNTESDGNEKRSVNFKAGFTPIENLEVNAFARWLRSVIETDNQPSVAGTIVTVDSEDHTVTRQRTGRLSAKYTMANGNWEHLAGIAFNDDRSESLSGGAPSRGNGSKTRFDYQTNLFFETPEYAGANHSLTLLFDHERDAQQTASNFGFTNLAVVNKGYSGEYRVSLWKKLFFSGAARFDDNGFFDDRLTGRTTLAYLHGDTGTRFHGSYATGAKNPTLFELFGSGANFTANPSLRTETSEGWDIGVEKKLMGGRTSIDVTYFKNLITDLITGNGTSAVNRDGTSIVNGVEVSASTRVTPDLTVKGQYTYTLGQDAARTQLVRRARHMASLNANYRFLENRANFNLGIDYTGEQKDTEFSNNFGTSTRINLDRYILLNAAASYDLTERVQLYGRLENILDDRFQDALGFHSPGLSAIFGVRTRVKLQ